MLFLYAMNVHLFVPTTKIRLFVGISSYSCHKETKKVVCAWKYYGIKKNVAVDRCIPAAIHRRLWRLNYFWYNSLLFVFAIFISCYINIFLYTICFRPFNPLVFRCPILSWLHTLWTNGSFYLYLDNFIFILISFILLVFALVLNTVDIALVKFSFLWFKNDDWMYIFYYLT